jgi:hypothetical protein|uniref:SP-RING-type domain-containing protein n=1 Tax=viral metagenome TaxID=1070528 RepID=A0A6C0IVH2_9ZZZZ
MKILRKRVGSLLLDENDIKKIDIVNDSILLCQKIIFNYLPIKNLTFFVLTIDKSNMVISKDDTTSIKTKYWVFLELNLDLLYTDIINGKIITSRDIIFDLIRTSVTRLKLVSNQNNMINIKSFNLSTELTNDSEFKHDSIYCFEKTFVKYGKIYFDINRKLITTDKCKKKRIKLPTIILLKGYRQLVTTIKNIYVDLNDTETLIIISKKDVNILQSPLFNPFITNNKISKETVVFSEDLNFQMNNYSNEINNEDLFNQLEFESSNFFYSKKNIFILANNLNEISINYLSFCNFDRLFILESKYIYQNNYSMLNQIVYKYDNYRISKTDNYNNMLTSKYILNNRVFIINDDSKNIEKHDLKIKDFPYIEWNNISDNHFITLERNNNISTFVQIGMNNEWSSSYIENLKKNISNDSSNNTCPISLSELNSFAISTECHHCFNLKNIIKWIDDKNECPICRSILNINMFKFINTPESLDYSNFINQVTDANDNIIIIVDKLWYNKLKQYNIVILQDDIINSNFKLSNNVLTRIINLSSLTNDDIQYIYSNSNQNIQFINLISDDTV